MGRRETLYLPNAVFISMAHVIGIVGIYAAFVGLWTRQTIVLALVFYCISGLGITVGYHRYFTHRSFKCGKVLQVVLAFAGTIAVQNSIKSWTSDHRRHHDHTDTEKDPYNASRGFWWSHIGWLLFKTPERRFDYTPADEQFAGTWTAKLVAFQHRYYYILATLLSGVVPLSIASLWDDPWGGIIFAGFSRLLLVWHMTFCINSLAHMKHWGSSQPYTRKTSAQDSWMVSLLTFGEGYHNYHHAFPGDYRNGSRWYNFDPSKWLIFLGSVVRVTWDLNRVPRWKFMLG